MKGQRLLRFLDTHSNTERKEFLHRLKSQDVPDIDLKSIRQEVVKIHALTCSKSHSQCIIGYGQYLRI